MSGMPKPFAFLRLPRGHSLRRSRGWKYQLKRDYRTKTAVYPEAGRGFVHDRWIELDAEGWLTISEGYSWDGPSGPTIDTPNFMRGSLVHDALYQLMREGHIARRWQKGADLELFWICRADGMSLIRAACVYLGVRIFGRFATLR